MTCLVKQQVEDDIEDSQGNKYYIKGSEVLSYLWSDNFWVFVT